MLSLRSFSAVTVACSLLLAGPALAARTQPVGTKADRPATTARRGATARPAAKPAAVHKGARRAGAPAVALAVLPPAATPVAPTPPASAVVAAPQFISLAGVVLNPDGRPCPGVCVFPTTNTHQIAVTDAQGNFQLQVPAQTALNLQAECVGLGSSRVAVDSHTPQPIRIVLGR